MDDVVIWVNARCSKSRGADALLAERGVAATRRAYLEDPPSRAELEDVLRKLGTDDPRALARLGDAPELRQASRDEVLDALAARPELVERPVVIRGDRAVVARPPERLLELLDEAGR